MSFLDIFKKKPVAEQKKIRTDGYENVYTGLGTSRDKATFYTYTGNARLNDSTLEDLYHNNDLAARICDALPEDALRQGYQITSADFETESDEPTHEKRLAKKDRKFTDIMMKLDELGAREKLTDAGIWARVFGAGIVYCGINDGNAQDEPVDEERIQSLDFLTVLDKRDLYPNTYYEDPHNDKFGQPETYRLAVTNGYAATNQQDVIIHASRLIVFEGSRTSRRRKVFNQYWSDSALQKVDEVLTQFNTSFQNVSHLMTDAAQAVFKMSGMIQMASSETPELVKARLAYMDMNRANSRMLVVDADKNEDFKRDTYSFNGIQPLLDRFMLRLAAAARMPVMILMGQSPGGLNATGDGEIRWWYDTVKSYQKFQLKPALEQLVKWCMLSKEGPTKGKELDNWAVTFPSLWQLSEVEKADIEKTEAETRKINAEAALLEKQFAGVVRVAEPAAESPKVTVEEKTEENSAAEEKSDELTRAEIEKLQAETDKILAEIKLIEKIEADE